MKLWSRVDWRFARGARCGTSTAPNRSTRRRHPWALKTAASEIVIVIQHQIAMLGKRPRA